MIGAGADLFDEEGAVFHERRSEGDDHRRGQFQPVNLSEAGFQKAVCAGTWSS
jgi:hypothetical protein